MCFSVRVLIGIANSAAISERLRGEQRGRRTTMGARDDAFVFPHAVCGFKTHMVPQARRPSSTSD